MHLPAPLLFRSIRNAAFIWVGVRVLIWAGGRAMMPVADAAMPGAAAGLGGGGGAVFLQVLSGMAIALAVLGLSWIDLRITRERLLMGNLGMGPLVMAAPVVATALSLEALVAILGALLRGGLS